MTYQVGGADERPKVLVRGQPVPVWSEKEENLVWRLYDEGHKPAAIAKVVGRTESAITSKLHLMRRERGLVRKRKSMNGGDRHGKPWTAEEVKQLRELCEKGVKYRLIAKELGRTKSGVWTKAMEIGVPARRRCPGKEVIAQSTLQPTPSKSCYTVKLTGPDGFSHEREVDKEMALSFLAALL